MAITFSLLLPTAQHNSTWNKNDTRIKKSKTDQSASLSFNVAYQHYTRHLTFLGEDEKWEKLKELKVFKAFSKFYKKGARTILFSMLMAIRMR